MTTSLSMAGAQSPWLSEAWRLYAIREKRGKADNKDIMALYRDVGHPGIAHDETPWCAAFLGACLERAGLRSTRSLMARSYALWGKAIDQPRLGAIVVLSRGPDPVFGHVGFWLGATSKKIFLLGGNQSDAVSVAAFDKDRLVALRWPDGESGNDACEDDICTSAADRGPSLEGKPDFARALTHILEMEGGYSEDPYDPGGPTNFGITLKVFAGWKGARLTAANRLRLKAELKKISQSDVAAIYRKNYWQRAECALFSPGLALMHFDCAVNQGVSRAIRFLQTAVGTDVDGEIGPLTLGAARHMPAATALANYADVRRRHYRSLHHYWRFGRGWLRRVARTLALAQELEAAGGERRFETSPPPSHQDAASSFQQGAAPPSATPSDYETQVKEADMPTRQPMPGKGKWWGHSMTIWGVVITTLSTVLPTLGPAIGVDVTPDLVKDAGNQLVTTVQAISALIGTLMTIYGRARATKPLAQRAVSLHI